MSDDFSKNVHSEDYLSTEVQEILGQPPHWLYTWGAVAIVCSIALLVLVSILFIYPDLIQGELVLKTAEPPVPVVASSTGYLSEIRVKEGTSVGKDEVLAVFSTTAAADDVLKLETEMEKLSEFDLETLRLFKPDWELKLGELTTSYSTFVNVLEYLPFSQNFRTDEVALSDIGSYTRQIQADIKLLQKRRDDKNKELSDALAKGAAIHRSYTSSGDQNEGPKLIEANLNSKRIDAELKNLEAQVEKRKEELLNSKAKMLELQVDHESGTKEKIFQIKQSLTDLKAEIRRWKVQYLVQAPAAGKVSFFNELSEKQHKRVGDELMVIVPVTNEKKYVGQVKLPAKGSGKVKEGQSVTIKFDRFPYREFGFVAGEVSKIYAMPAGDAYFVEVSLKKGLKTSMGKELEFQQNLTAKAEIATAERSFFSRLFEKLLY